MIRAGIIAFDKRGQVLQCCSQFFEFRPGEKMIDVKKRIAQHHMVSGAHYIAVILDATDVDRHPSILLRMSDEPGILDISEA